YLTGVVESRRPHFRIGQPTAWPINEFLALERLYMPLAGAGATVDMILGFTVFLKKDGSEFSSPSPARAQTPGARADARGLLQRRTDAADGGQIGQMADRSRTDPSAGAAANSIYVSKSYPRRARQADRSDRFFGDSARVRCDGNAGGAGWRYPRRV